ncbi:MAG TPA: 5'-nucleotidase [Acidimicrobiales bacterium]|nr:5'-nucleotidase [Acidimicrobiales bacterium]
MGYTLDDKLVVAISSRALFALDEADSVFREHGLEAYRRHQRELENVPLAPGTGMPLVRGLLRINKVVGQALVEVIVVSRNDADSGLRIFNSIEAMELDVTRAAFTDGADPLPYLAPFVCDLFLSSEPEVVQTALRRGFPAARVMNPPEDFDEEPVGPVKIAFDGDAVLFDDESERVFQSQGLEAFLARERDLADVPMNPGPFRAFLGALGRVQSVAGVEHDVIRTALVTARNAPATKRVVNTLRAWDVRVDESFFLGGIEKAGVLAAMKAHIFFDDQHVHLDPAHTTTPSAHVPPVA